MGNTLEGWNIKIVAVEEHFVTREVCDAYANGSVAKALLTKVDELFTQPPEIVQAIISDRMSATTFIED